MPPVKTIICDDKLAFAPNGTYASGEAPKPTRYSYTTHVPAMEKFVQVHIGYYVSRAYVGQTTTLFTDSSRQEAVLHDLPPRVDVVEMTIGFDVGLQDFRCQVLDDEGEPIPLMHLGVPGTRSLDKIYTDMTFSTGEEWRTNGVTPRKVVCDPSFRSRPEIKSVYEA